SRDARRRAQPRIRRARLPPRRRPSGAPSTPILRAFCLLPDAERREDPLEELLRRGLAGDLAEREERAPHLGGDQLVAGTASHALLRQLEGGAGSAERLAMARQDEEAVGALRAAEARGDEAG